MNQHELQSLKSEVVQINTKRQQDPTLSSMKNQGRLAEDAETRKDAKGESILE